MDPLRVNCLLVGESNFLKFKGITKEKKHCPFCKAMEVELGDFLPRYRELPQIRVNWLEGNFDVLLLCIFTSNGCQQTIVMEGNFLSKAVEVGRKGPN